MHASGHQRAAIAVIGFGVVVLAVSPIHVTGCRSLSPAQRSEFREPPPVIRTTRLSGYAAHMIETRDGKLVLCGAERIDEDRTIAALALVDSDGRELWKRTYDDVKARVFGWVDETLDGGFVVVGTAPDAWSKASDIEVVRLDRDGGVIRSRTYGGDGHEHAASVEETRDGDLIVCGLTASYGAGESDAYLLRLSSSGEVLWEKTFGGETWEGQYEDGSRAFQTKDGGFVVVGSSDSKSIIPTGASVAVYLVRTDPSGGKLWERAYGIRGGFDVGSAVRELEGGDFVISGTRHNVRDGLYVIRTDPEGDVVWERSLEVPLTHGYVALEVTGDGGFLVGNRASSRGETDAYLVRLDATGRPLWEHRFGTDGYHRVHSIEELNEGGYAVLCSGPDWEPYLVRLEAENAEKSG